MLNIPLFDSLSHPSLDGNWLGDRFRGENTLDHYVDQMAPNDVKWAFCVGMEKVGSYNPALYSQFIRARSPKLFPIAYYPYDSDQEAPEKIRAKLELLKGQAYSGIKLHPRFSNIQLGAPALREIIRIANDLNLLVLLCTQVECRGAISYQNHILQIAQLLYELDDPKLILLHGGTVQLMELMEKVRPYSRVVLDLSYTLCKYEGSSIDLDIAFLFRNFDQRICVGSDSPEYTVKKLRQRFDLFAEGLPQKKQENIGYLNLMRLIEG